MRTLITAVKKNELLKFTCTGVPVYNNAKSQHTNDKWDSENEIPKQKPTGKQYNKDTRRELGMLSLCNNYMLVSQHREWSKNHTTHSWHMFICQEINHTEIRKQKTSVSNAHYVQWCTCTYFSSCLHDVHDMEEIESL